MADKQVQVTADALTAIRSDSVLAGELGLICPHDHLFVTEGGQQMAAMALKLDPVYEQYNLVRYRRFTELMLEAAEAGHVVAVLGAGFDTRALLLAERFANGLFVEVDFAEKLAEKGRVLVAGGIAVPENVHPVGADLSELDLDAVLGSLGIDRDRPVSVFIEGATFFLPEETTRRLCRPSLAGFTRRSSLTTDCWTAPRAEALNAAVEPVIGRRLFGKSPYGRDTSDVVSFFSDAGFAGVEAKPLGAWSADYGVDRIEDPLGPSWILVEART